MAAKYPKPTNSNTQSGVIPKDGVIYWYIDKPPFITSQEYDKIVVVFTTAFQDWEDQIGHPDKPSATFKRELIPTSPSILIRIDKLSYEQIIKASGDSMINRNYLVPIVTDLRKGSKEATIIIRSLERFSLSLTEDNKNWYNLYTAALVSIGYALGGLRTDMDGSYLPDFYKGWEYQIPEEKVSRIRTKYASYYESLLLGEITNGEDAQVITPEDLEEISKSKDIGAFKSTKEKDSGSWWNRFTKQVKKTFR